MKDLRKILCPQGPVGKSRRLSKGQGNTEMLLEAMGL